MTVSIIAAVAENGAIGKNNDLIWHLPKDMEFFKSTTQGHHVIMGRRNFESIPHRFRPLQGRPNIVVTNQKEYDAQGAEVVNSLEEALAIAKERGESEAFVIGGGQIYELALQKDLIDKMYLTHIHESFDADTFFPQFDDSKWQKECIHEHKQDEKNPHDFEIFTYIRSR